MKRTLRSLVVVGTLGVCLAGPVPSLSARGQCAVLGGWPRTEPVGSRSVRGIGRLVRGWYGAGVSGLATADSFHRELTAAQESREKPEEQGHELLFKIINFALLAGGLAYILRKPLADFFASRSQSVRKSLEEGRKALEASAAQLQAVEQKLAHLEEEIAAFKASAAKEMEAEGQRMKQAAAEEAEKVLASARAQIETSVRAAKLDLKSYTAKQAVESAEELIRQRLDDSGRKRLLAEFVAGLKSSR